MPIANIASVEDSLRRMTPLAAAPAQLAELQALSRVLEHVAHTPRRRCRLEGPDGQSISLPEPIFSVLVRVAEVLARGDAITVVPVGRKLTTQQAADLLNVSRQYLIRLLDDRAIPYTKTGTHRRLRIEDVLAYKDRRDRDRSTKLTSLQQMSEDFGGYKEFD